MGALRKSPHLQRTNMTTNHAVRRLLQMDATRPGVGRACQEMLAELINARPPRPTPQQDSAELVAALRKGVSSTDWPRYASSRKSLHVRIYALRERGFIIESIQIEQGALPVMYKLVSEPTPAGVR